LIKRHANRQPHKKPFPLARSKKVADPFSWKNEAVTLFADHWKMSEQACSR
jgi:hypothetical protein